MAALPELPPPPPPEAGGEAQDGGEDEEGLRTLKALLRDLRLFRARLRGDADGGGCYDDSDDDDDDDDSSSDGGSDSDRGDDDGDEGDDGDDGGGGTGGDDGGGGTGGDGGGGGTGGDPGDRRRRRRELLRAEVQRTLRRMEEVAVPPHQQGPALVLRARALALAPRGPPGDGDGGDVIGDVMEGAESALRRAVKMAPGLAGAWWHLGRLRWHRGDVAGARLCFGAAAARAPHKAALRGLSVALRRGGGPAAQSVEHAKAAVRLDPRDGRSWHVLANAYVWLFFAGGQSPGAARSALAAYARAEQVDPRAARNPDLHLNRAALLQFTEQYGAALAALGRAARGPPGSASGSGSSAGRARRRRRRLRRFLRDLCDLLRSRCPPDVPGVPLMSPLSPLSPVSP